MDTNVSKENTASILRDEHPVIDTDFITIGCNSYVKTEETAMLKRYVFGNKGTK
jgi:hypothetical protein